MKIDNTIFGRYSLSILILSVASLCMFVPPTLGQEARVYEQSKRIKTYPFDDPNPVPYKKEIYPYFRFDGYSFKGKSKKWDVIYLENKYIKVSVLPGVGGKVWGAIEKSTGNDFIYHNHVLKFRDIALRGPWTSGGIEFNFGIQGHTPTTATPVDYLLRKNKDGSVSCFIGAIDLASRTRWRVEIRLPKDAATFQTKGFWYNSTSLNQSYYYWSNAAIHADSSLQYYFPGTHYITHGGKAHPWPITEKGRNLSYYRNIPLEGGSFHVLGTYENYFAAYWDDKNVGFGQWSRYNEIPGKKIFVWGVEKAGSIWKDLLTDNDGQYTEVQGGRLFSQAGLSSGLASPFNQKLFSPGAADRWKEDWFPVKNIGGISDASPYAAINVTPDSSGLAIKINAIRPLKDTLKIFKENKLIHKESIKLQPMEVFNTKFKTTLDSDNYSVKFGGKLNVSAKSQKHKLQRPLHSTQKYSSDTAEDFFRRGEEQFAHRHYNEALQLFLSSLDKNGNNQQVLARTAQVYTRKAKYKLALKYARRILANDAYDAEGNFIYGIINRRIGRLSQAEEAFGWAARSSKYRSAGWEQMAEINIQKRKWNDAIHYARKALNYNKFNMNANKVLVIAYRKLNKNQKANKVIEEMLNIDPLCHFAYFEKYLLKPADDNIESFNTLIRNELPYETYLELAMTYHNMGLEEEAKKVLNNSPSYPIVNYWLAYLNRNNHTQKSQEYLNKALAESPKLVFPFRYETIPVLKWALSKKDNWKTTYYLGLIMWGKGRNEQALELLTECGNEPDFAPFYLTRSKLFKSKDAEQPVQDMKRALELDKGQWRTYRALSSWYMSHNKTLKALNILEKAHKLFPDNYYLGVQFANVLLQNDEYEKSYNVLDNLKVLPSEGAKRAHNIFEKALVKLAIQNMRERNFNDALDHFKASQTWPEHLGVGKPHNPDDRVQDFLTAKIYEKQNKSKLADSLYHEIYAYSERKGVDNIREFSFSNLISLITYERYGQKQKAKNIRDQFVQSLGQEENNTITNWLKAYQNSKSDQINAIENDILENKKSLQKYDLFKAYLQLKNEGILAHTSHK